MEGHHQKLQEKGVSRKSFFFKGNMILIKWEFPEGWAVTPKNPSVGRGMESSEIAGVYKMSHSLARSAMQAFSGSVRKPESQLVIKS